MAVELRYWVFRDIEVDVSVFDTLGNVFTTVLNGKIAAKSGFVSAAVLQGE